MRLEESRGPEPPQAKACNFAELVSSLAGSDPTNPAPGFRGAGNDGRLGSLVYVSSNGYSWSSAVSGINGRFLWFSARDIDPINTNTRGHGFQLRCLSE